MFIWNYSHSLKHFLKIRRELKARHWGNILHKYGLGVLALGTILEVEASTHVINTKIQLQTGKMTGIGEFVIWNSVSYPELAEVFALDQERDMHIFFSILLNEPGFSK